MVEKTLILNSYRQRLFSSKTSKIQSRSRLHNDGHFSLVYCPHGLNYDEYEDMRCSKDAEIEDMRNSKDAEISSNRAEIRLLYVVIFLPSFSTSQ